MPLLETTASVDSACISTAPVFDSRKKDGEGSPKTLDDGWWALFIHNRSGARPIGGFLNTLLWLLWVVAFGATALIPASRFFLFLASVCCLVLLGALIPDDGSTVLPYYLHIILPIMSFKSAIASSIFGKHWSFTLFYFIFGVVPLADWIIGMDCANQTKEEQKQLNGEFKWKLHTLLVPVCVLAMIFSGAFFVQCLAEGDEEGLFRNTFSEQCSAISQLRSPLSLTEFIGFGVSAGFYSGAIGIVVGHELCHKASQMERALGRFLLCAVCYGHFYVEHTLGHHKDVATDADPATARYGENFYAFVPRVVSGEFISACRIEAARLRKKGLPWWENEILLSTAASSGIAYAVYVTCGLTGLGFFCIQALWAIVLFESVNYLEHYGLERRQRPDGSHETVQPQHSWDSPARFTNTILIKLQRHADHHAHAGKRYQTLQAYDESPQLPSGYATMIMLAFVPPLWRAVMHPRLMKFRATQEGQVWRHGPQPSASEAHSDKKSK